ncbi:MAG TPA: hypothetical protein PKE55_06965 [Kiritimatiellia bacterium]|nr:hypothetical protein [Kiritimatiellia bacterium]
MKTLSLAVILALLSLATPRAHALEPYVSGTISVPLGISAGLGLKIRPSAPYSPVLEAEAGIGGGRLSLGLDSIRDSFGVGARASLLKTWFEPVSADENVTYLGADLLAGYSSFIAHLGGYRRVEGRGDGWQVSAGLGWRF